MQPHVLYLGELWVLLANCNPNPNPKPSSHPKVLPRLYMWQVPMPHGQVQAARDVRRRQEGAVLQEEMWLHRVEMKVLVETSLWRKM